MFDLRNRSILITGGSGSFGNECTRILLREYQPARLIIFSRDELKQHEMRVSGLNHPSLHYVIGDVRDADRLRRAMAGVDVAIHAAALKHVPTCELNPMEAIQTNIHGARNVIDAALEQGVQRVLAMSTDKAVQPASVYGATKLVAERLFTQANFDRAESLVRFSSVRYGNVANSRGSIVPLFREQRKSGHITITDPRMTRFWIGAQQGVRFVLSSIQTMTGGEIFIPRIPSLRVADLARTIAPGCEVRQIGIRPGERLHELLLSEEEARHAVELQDRFVILPNNPDGNFQNEIHGSPLPEGFRYDSETNTEWVSDNDLRALADEENTFSPSAITGP